MRTFLNLQDEVLALGFDPATYRSRVKTWLNEALHRIARTSRLDDDTATLTTTPTTRYVSLPVPLIRIISLVDDQQQFLEPLDLTDFQALISLAPSASGRPAQYAIQQGRAQFFPLPDKAYALTLTYRSNPTSFNNDGDTVVTIGLPDGMDDYCHVLIDWAASRAYRNEDDAEMANYYMAEFQREFSVLRGDLGLPIEAQARQIPGTYGESTPGPRFRMPGR
jgi:hypothetical protein